MNVFLPLQALQNKHLRKCVFLLSCLAVFAVFGLNAAAENDLLLEPVPAFEKSPAFKALLNIDPGAGGYEIKRIEYLLERITRTTSTFIRNGENYPGRTAMLLMRWKYARYQQEIKTAEHFVERIANGSRKTGEDYKVRFKDGSVHKVTTVLFNELMQLEQALADARAASQESLKSIPADAGTQI